MFYQVRNILKAGHEVPEATAGFDRLSWNSPVPHVNQKISEMILDGKMPRYYGPLDQSFMTPNSSEAYTTFPTLAAAEEWQDFCLGNGNQETNTTISSTIEEVPEYVIGPENYQV